MTPPLRLGSRLLQWKRLINILTLTAVTGACLLLPRTGISDAHPGEEIRRFLHDLVEVSTTDPPNVRLIRGVLYKYRVIVDQILVTRDFNGMFRQAGLAPEDLGLSPARFKEMTRDLLGNPSGLTVWAGRKYLGLFGLGSPNWADLLAHAEILKMANAIQRMVSNPGMSTPGIVGELLALKGSQEQNLAGLDFTKFLMRYAQGLPSSKRREMILNFLSLPSDASDVDKAMAFLKPCGVAMKKFMQYLGEEFRSEVAQELGRRLQAEAPGSPAEVAKEIIERNLGRPMSEVFVSVNDVLSSSHSGTVGQAFQGHTRWGDDVTMKIIHPWVADDLRWEIPLIREITRDMPAAQALTSVFLPGIQRESDLRQERANLVRGKVFEAPRAGVEVARLYDRFPSTAEFLAMWTAKGEPISTLNFDALSGAELAHIGQAVTAVSRRVGTAMILGAAHDDLSPGNMLYMRTPERRFPGFRITILDFGSTSELNPGELHWLLALAAACMSGDESEAMKVLATLGPIARDSWLPMSKSIRKILSAPPNPLPSRTLPAKTLPSKTLMVKLQEVLLVGTAHGLVPPGSLGRSFRSVGYLERLAQKVNRAMDRVDPGQGYTRSHPMKGLQDAVAMTLAQETGKDLLAGKAPLMGIHEGAKAGAGYVKICVMEALGGSGAKQ